MKTEILKIKGNWQDVVNDCRATVSKPPLGKEPSKKFKQQLLISEHSPIRNISVKWQWRDIKSWVATHWSRHKWECYISTQRSDRTGVDRDKLPQDSPVTFSGEANVQNLIDTMRKRLCCRASPETRKLAENFKQELYEHEPEISDALVPNCVYRCGCPEGGKCEFFSTLITKNDQVLSTDIQERYEAYNHWFWRFDND